MRHFYNRDCMEGMKEFPDKYFDLAIVDPPYGIGDFIQGIGPQKKHINWEVKWNDAKPTLSYFEELKRVSKNQIIWGANYYNCFNEKGGAIIWDKNVTHPDMSKAEIASVSHFKKVEIYREEWNGFIKSEKSKSIHPCQKPVNLYIWIIQKYTGSDDLILDTHVGSASSLIACEMMGFEYVGFEIDKDYYEAAVKRIENFRKQIPLSFKLAQKEAGGKPAGNKQPELPLKDLTGGAG